MQERLSRLREYQVPLSETSMPNVILAEGKTKQILTTETSGIVRIVNSDAITAGDGTRRDIIEGKGIMATTTTVNVFQLLEASGIPTHFQEQDSPNSFLAVNCQMIPFEAVARRVATGSYVQRHPDVKKGYEFLKPKFELFLKRNEQNDPFMEIDGGTITIHNAHAKLGTGKISEQTLADFNVLPSEIAQMEKVTNAVFEILERAWSEQGIKMQDVKIEFGRNPEGEIIVADVIDNDSWRILKEGRHLDKQAYRDGVSLDVVRANYMEVAEITGNFGNN